MDETIRSQILEIRATGLTNMFDIPAVQRLAYERALYELVDWLVDHPREYAMFIMHGDPNTRQTGP